MQGLRKEDWRYALLLVVLFAIAARATQVAINYITATVGDHDRVVITLLLCAILLGLMLISGAFTIWAIKFESKSAGMQRLSDLVDAMAYIKDGVVAINSKGLIRGMNPAAQALFNISNSHKYTLKMLCPNLSPKDVETLLNSNLQAEIECEFLRNGKSHTLRFRSQPSKNMSIILINDVTLLAEMRTRHRQSAYLQLVGHIAQGIANDFNNILCGISGYASLILMPASTEKIISDSARAISTHANRGIQLASSLLELSNTSHDSESAAVVPASHVVNAVDAIVADLHGSWNITRSIDNTVPPVNLTGVQLEHIVHGLGMLAADIHSDDRSFYIRLAYPSDAGLCQTDCINCSGVIIIAPTDPTTIEAAPLRLRDDGSVGTIESVVSSILQQAGGKLDSFTTKSGIPVYRISLPTASSAQIKSHQESLPLGLEAYIANWNVLICKGQLINSELRLYLESCGVNTIYTEGIVDTLARIEHGDDLHAIIIQSSSLGDEREGLLRAITKLCPQAGLVVINKNTPPIKELQSDIIFIPHNHTPAQIAQAIIDARTMAHARDKASAGASS